MKGIVKLNRSVLAIGKTISSISILAMMFLIVADVFLRNVFGTPVAGTYMIVESFLMPLAVFPALGYAYMIGILPRLNEFIEKRPNWFQRINAILIHIIDIVVFVLLTYFSFSYAMSGMEESMSISIATKLIPVWPVFFIVPLGYLLVLSELIMKLVQGKPFYEPSILKDKV